MIRYDVMVVIISNRKEYVVATLTIALRKYTKIRNTSI